MKYLFKPYNRLFPQLFQAEKERIAFHVTASITIEHIGSTAIPGLGGKGIIDIAAAVKKEEMESVSHELQTLGYVFRPQWSTPDRFYFRIDLPDAEEGIRRYHLHLTYPENPAWHEWLFFRDYLKHHPHDLKEYELLKHAASIATDEEGKTYRELKDPFIKKIILRKK